MKIKSRIPFWGVPVVIVLAIGTVWLRLSIIRTTYQINQTDHAIHAAQQEREQMQLKVTELRSPRRLEILAKTKFGLTQPKAEQVMHVREPEAN